MNKQTDALKKDIQDLIESKAKAIARYESELAEARKEAMKIDWSKVGKPGPAPDKI